MESNQDLIGYEPSAFTIMLQAQRLELRTGLAPALNSFADRCITFLPPQHVLVPLPGLEPRMQLSQS